MKIRSITQCDTPFGVWIIPNLRESRPRKTTKIGRVLAKLGRTFLSSPTLVYLKPGFGHTFNVNHSGIDISIFIDHQYQLPDQMGEKKFDLKNRKNDIF